MTASRGGPRPTMRSRRKCWRARRPPEAGEFDMDKRPALGKGLSALIPDAPPAASPGPLQVDIDLLSPNQQQPRHQMDDARLDELARSIQEIGRASCRERV